MAAMESLALFFSGFGRIAPKAFAIGAIVVYLLGFLSQFLLAAPLMARGGLVVFVLLQALVTWAWYALHAKRLRDSGRSVAAAAAIAILYALAVVLLLLVMAAATAPTPSAGGEAPAAGIFEVFLVVFLILLILRDPNLGIFGLIVLGVLAIVMLPFLIAVAFSIWLGTRPSAPQSP
jgi:uncharacterized membrane protein YhaH (DUF805 family)